MAVWERATSRSKAPDCPGWTPPLPFLMWSFAYLQRRTCIMWNPKKFETTYSALNHSFVEFVWQTTFTNFPESPDMYLKHILVGFEMYLRLVATVFETLLLFLFLLVGTLDSTCAEMSKMSEVGCIFQYSAHIIRQRQSDCINHLEIPLWRQSHQMHCPPPPSCGTWPCQRPASFSRVSLKYSNFETFLHE